jgi:hypothetical protein
LPDDCRARDGPQVDVCKLVPTFPRSMSACVRECFSRLGAMDPELRGRLSDWLAYHLSNFEFMWPWDKWRAVLDAPPHNAQRRAPRPPCCPAASRVQEGAGQRCVHAAWRHRLAPGSATCALCPDNQKRVLLQRICARTWEHACSLLCAAVEGCLHLQHWPGLRVL